MYLKNILSTKKIAIILLAFILSMPFFSHPAFAYWDKLSASDQILLTTGEWATPITTAAQFKALSEKTNALSTDVYIIMNDLDFSSTTWTYNSNNRSRTFRGKIYGNNKTISNLTISNNYNSNNYIYHGIFARMQDASVYNLKFNNINLMLNTTSLSGTRISAGLLTGNVYGGINNFKNITIINSGVRATSSNGSGGLVGLVNGATTVINIENVKTTNLKVFNKSSNTGGLVGRINSSGATLNVQDVDLDGEVHSYNSTSYTGGIVGNIISGGIVNITRAVLDITSRNTLETSSTYRDKYSQQYLGGVVGYTASASANVNISSIFFTGSLYTNANNRGNSVGTVTGYFTATSTRPTVSTSTTFHSYVQFRSTTNASIIYTPTAPTGQMATVVTPANALPTQTWWNNTFFPLLNLTNDYWEQGTDGRPNLVRL